MTPGLKHISAAIPYLIAYLIAYLIPYLIAERN